MSRTTALAAFALAAASLIPVAATAADEPELKWAFVAGVPRPVEMAIVSGNPDEAGPYVVRYRMPSGMRFAPHKYSDQRELTVVKGIWWMTPGESYNWRDMTEYQQGSVIVREAGKPYYAWARTAVLIEEKGTGPSTLQYVNPEDDPRNKRKPRRKGSGEE
ncbi:MAG: cupin domain-containing protein [Burkholderiales bacterium]